MDKTTEKSDQNEKQALMLEENISDEQPITKYYEEELDFSCFLIDTIEDLKKTIQSNQELIKHVLFSYHFCLLIVTATCFIYFAWGELFAKSSSDYKMMCIAFIVESTCGFLVALGHWFTILFELTPSKVRGLSVGYRLCILITITFAQLLTVFCILWFFIGHIWFKPCYYGRCDSRMYTYTIIMVIAQYIIGIWIVFRRIWNTRRVLHQFKRNTQQRLDQFPDYEKHLDIQESTLHSKNAESGSNNIQHLTII